MVLVWDHSYLYKNQNFIILLILLKSLKTTFLINSEIDKWEWPFTPKWPFILKRFIFILSIIFKYLEDKPYYIFQVILGARGFTLTLTTTTLDMVLIIFPNKPCKKLLKARFLDAYQKKISINSAKIILS